MAISESARSDLYNGLRDVLGIEGAETLMSAIPLHDLDEVATKSDVTALREATRADLADLRSELRGEMAALRTDLTGEMADLRSEMHKTMTAGFLTVATANIGAVVSIALILS